MKVKDWLIHKLGGVTKLEASFINSPPIQYKVYHPKVEKLKTYLNHHYAGIEEEHIVKELAFQFLPLIEKKMKVEQIIDESGEIWHKAELNIVMEDN